MSTRESSAAGPHPSDDRQLDQVLQGIDPLLVRSLQQDQRKRRIRTLMLGGAMMLALIGTVWLTMAWVTTDGDRTPSKSADDVRGASEVDQLTVAENAANAAREGWRLWQGGDPAAAETKFEEAVAADPRDPQSWNGLGWSRMNQAKYALARQAFERCLKLQKKHPAALNGMGQSLLMQRKYHEAEPYFRQAVREAPAARFGLARLLLLAERFEEAGDVLKSWPAAERGELDPQLMEQMEQAATDKQLSDELKGQLEPPAVTEESAADDPEEPTREEAAASSASKSARNKSVRKKKSSTESPVALNARGWQNLNSNKPRPAELAFRQALAADPSLVAAKNGLGFALLNQGKPEEAKTIFLALVKTDPRHAGFVNGLGRAHELLGEFDAAVAAWKTVDQADGPVTACTWGLARVLTETKKYDEALTYWRRIEVESPNDATVREMIEKCSAEK